MICKKSRISTPHGYVDNLAWPKLPHIPTGASTTSLFYMRRKKGILHSFLTSHVGAFLSNFISPSVGKNNCR